MILGLGLGLGMLGGMGLALVLESSDEGIKSAGEAERLLHLPTLGSVPDVFKITHNRRRRVGYVSRQALTSKVNHSSDGAALNELVSSQSMSPASEAYRAVRTALMCSLAGDLPKTLEITSSLAGEGKTLTTLNTSVCFAQLGGRTLLIDADLRRPRCHKLLGVENSIGLSDVLVEQVESRKAIRPTAIPGLFLLSSGSPATNPTELLGSRDMRRLMAELVIQFDYILIDAPPVLPVSDAVALSTITDGVLVIVAADTPKAAVREACGRLRYVGANILGLVLNKVDVFSPDYRYYNGYSYHSYYDYHPDNMNDQSALS
jgi:capsular exopolysaccharide synthesis family protein